MKVPAAARLRGVRDQRGAHLPLQEYGEALIQPEMLKVLVGHQVACPTVHYLMDYHIRLTSVPSLE